MSELTGKFLNQLKKDIATVSQGTGLAGQHLMDMSERLDISEEASEVPVSIDKSKGRIVIHAGHEAIKTLMNRTVRRRTDLVFVISSMMSLINREQESVTDEHEKVFHARLLTYALEECQGSWNTEL